MACIETVITMGRMNCNGCASNITRIAQSLPSVEVLVTDVPAKRVHLRYDSALTSLETIKAKLAESNYPVVAVDSGDNILSS